MHNQQLQTIMIQKQTLLVQQKEIERALDEMEGTKEVYKSVGPILIKASAQSVKKELTEQKEENELKIKALGKQEKTITSRLKEFQEKQIEGYGG